MTDEQFKALDRETGRDTGVVDAYFDSGRMAGRGVLQMTTNPMLTAGRWVEATRKVRKLTREQLAARAGVSVNTVYLLETGANTRMSSMCAVLDALDATFLISPTTTGRTT
jgi:DNA-binding XRE family transcriptional regulator